VSYIYSPPRRRRRGVWLLAVLSVVVIVVVLVASLRSERRLLAAYLDTSRQWAAVAAASAEDFADLTDRLPEVTREEFTTTMAAIRSASGASGPLLDEADVPADALDAHARLTLAHSSWLAGLELMEGAVLAAVDDPEDEDSVAVIGHAVVELAVGDRSYEGAVEQLAALEAEADIEVAPYPIVSFAPAAAGDEIAAAVRASADLGQRHDLAVTAAGFEPRPLGETPAGAGIIPFTDRLIVNATISNLGNEAVGSVDVQVVLTSDRTGTGGSRSETIERLGPGEATSLEFVFQVLPIANYDLVIDVAGTSGETNLDNNLVILPFVVNEEG
jgi:heme exporter protein D